MQEKSQKWDILEVKRADLLSFLAVEDSPLPSHALLLLIASV
jgi:hypothetical protein